ADHLATAGYENVIKLWQAYSAQLIRQLEHAGSQVNALSISPDRRTLAARRYEHIRLYESATRLVTSPSLSFDMQKNITAVGFDGHGKWMYSGGEDCVCRVWDLRHARGGQGGNPCSRLYLSATPPARCTSGIWRSNQSCSLVPDLDARIQSVAVNQAGTHWPLWPTPAAASCGRWPAPVTNVSGSQAVPKARIAAHSGYGLRCAFSPDSHPAGTCGSDRLCKFGKRPTIRNRSSLSPCPPTAAPLYSIDERRQAQAEYRGSTKSAGHGSTSAKPMTCLA
uniref:Target of rapamycin complex subunit lst8 n=1 Tax=Macrostomum lignano TaxID=282301 RepID=A0A1I8F618_9PLAT